MAHGKLFHQINRWNSLFAVFGLCPLISAINGKFTISYFRAAFSVAVVILLVLLSYFQYSQFSLDTDSIGYMVMKFYLNFFGILVAIFNILSSVGTCKKSVVMQHHLIDMDKKYHSRDDSRISSVSFNFLLIPTFTFLTSLLLDTIQYIVIDSGSSTLLNVLSVHVSLLYDILQIIQFSIYLSWLKWLLASINLVLGDSLTEILRSGNKRNREGLRNTFRKEKLFEITFRVPVEAVEREVSKAVASCSILVKEGKAVYFEDITKAIGHKMFAFNFCSIALNCVIMPSSYSMKKKLDEHPKISDFEFFPTKADILEKLLPCFSICLKIPVFGKLTSKLTLPDEDMIKF